ncbi:DUF4405 domain-containing protein [Consotaella salsifontis]|uniref:DUF4405 domain-containing protein n=1 Tax=Consotaella salsifontis TaxID=1365950 RepID=A0A1T4LB22_9HYPH|nr:DUF4405 domain-containing protein [Consotaella salsifontis]SJZ51935.1 hypothetical protein SAMN05428963_101142 [Consotaella salsifontis]
MTTIRNLLFRSATPFTVGLFLVSAISGTALFFGWAGRFFHEMHEVLSMILLIPIGLHLWRNWHAFANYFHGKWMPVALVLSLLAAGYYLLQPLPAGGGRGGNAAFALMRAAQSASVAELAPVVRLDAAEAVKRLDDAGYGPILADDSISTIAGRHGVDASIVFSKLLASAATADGRAQGR